MISIVDLRHTYATSASPNARRTVPRCYGAPELDKGNKIAPQTSTQRSTDVRATQSLNLDIFDRTGMKRVDHMTYRNTANVYG
jgi:hypothetical protein